MGVSHCTVENMPSQVHWEKNDPLLCCCSLLIYNCRVTLASAHNMYVLRPVNVCVLTILGCKHLEARQNLAEQGRGQQEDPCLYLWGHK